MEIINYSFFLYVFFLIIHYCLRSNCLAEAATTLNINTDQSTLLALKSNLNLNSSHILYKNWSASSYVCSWFGVTCSHRHERVSDLDISRMGVEGNLLSVPQLRNLSFLVSLDLSFNNIGGDIPLWFGFFPRLRILRLRNNTFTGVIPSSLSNLSKLEYLDLSFNPLHEGVIPQEIGNLQNLKVLALQDNQLTGSIPLAFFNFSKLETLALTLNTLSGNLPDNLCQGLPKIEGLYLGGNELFGKIPTNLSACSKIELLGLSRNKFQGLIPREIGNMQTLKILELGSNNLIGEIPEELGNATSLEKLSMYTNHLVGSIPHGIFNISSLRRISIGENSLRDVLPADMCSSLKQLELLDLGQNELYGYIPTRLFQCSSLRELDLTYSRLQGPIPTDVGNLTLLEGLYLGGNNLTGEIPSTLFNISTLRIVFLTTNQLSGSLPSDLGHGLPNLETLSLASNNFRSESPELNFITSLTNCRYLRKLDISGNPLKGVLPTSIGNLSTSLERIDAYFNDLRGSIPHEIGNLGKLIILNLFGNHLSGSLPESLGNLKNLQVLELSINKIHGTIPNTICELVYLFDLRLHDNQISNGIPACLGRNLTSLRSLHLANNKLNSIIPTNLWLIKDLQWLNLSSNSFVGSLPPEIGNLKATIEIDLSMNQFSGIIPSTIGGLVTLNTLSLNHNKFQGPIPESIAEIVSLENLDLSHNSLSGHIPPSLRKLQHLVYFNVSFNNLSGKIPSDGPFKTFSSQSFLSNKGLCGDSKYDVPPCPIVHVKRSKGKLKLVIVSVAIAVIVLALSLAYVLAKYKKRQGVPLTSNKWSVPTPLRFSYYKLLEATERYAESRFLGSGSFGSVYKGTLRNGTDVAIKVFNLDSEGAYNSFEVECKVLRELRHKNLCKVMGSCSNQDFKALVLKYMPNGSLEKWLYSYNNFLDIHQRMSVMIDVAYALEYLHYGYSMPIIHCDIKPSNVLFDENMAAYLSDFGISKLLDDGESKARTMTLATLGYIAPEFGTDGLVSTRCDVYSYGIMLMEVFTRVKPNDETFDGNLSLRSWVKDSMPNGIIHIVDSNLLKPEEERLSAKLKCLSSILELALHCSMESPRERINIKDVCVTLEKIQNQLLAYN